MAEYAPAFKPGRDVTFFAKGDVKAGTLVEVVGDYTAQTAGADSTKVCGTALSDAAEGEGFVPQSGGVQRLIASGAIAAGDRVAPAAGGRVKSATTGTIGQAYTAAADGAIVEVHVTLV